MAVANSASRDDTGNNRRQDSFAWAQNKIYEMLESEPQPVDKENEGNDEAHRPLWIIASPGSEQRSKVLPDMFPSPFPLRPT